MTPAQMISESLELLGIIAPGESVEAGEQASCLRSLNTMLDAWNVEGTLVYATTRTTKVLTASDGSYSIGTSGDINVTQPVRIDAAGLILANNSYEYPISVLTTAEWEAYYDKSGAVTAPPSAVYFQPSSAITGTIYPLPVPDDAHTLALYLGTQLSQIAASDLSTDYALRPGYRRAIVYNLAVEYAPKANKSVTPEIAAIALMSTSKIKNANSEPAVMACDEAMLGCGDGWINSAAFKRGY